MSNINVRIQKTYLESFIQKKKPSKKTKTKQKKKQSQNKGNKMMAICNLSLS